MKRESFLCEKSKALALRMIRLYQYFCEEKKEFVISKQILRSGTSIGANIREAIRAQSNADFIAKLYISLKETEETLYWLELLRDAEYIPYKNIQAIYDESESMVKVLNRSIISAKQGQGYDIVLLNANTKKVII